MRAALLAAVLISAALPAQAAAVTYEFPPGETGYHTYEEMAAEVAAAAAAYPAIVERFSIGKSHSGRELWAVKISDNVATDEAEPEVLLEGLHHGDEHMATEMTLAMLRWLTEGYATDPRVTAIVDSREIWIVLEVNPDGATWNIKDRVYQNWRKNRQPTPGSTAIGTDLNRNYDYMWGCCGGASSNPRDSRYRGPKPFSAPETRALRDFVNSRVVGGRQQIRASISFHTTGRLVSWPFSYTTADVPATMTAADHSAFVALAKGMAVRNGYKPQQAGDRYIHSGTALDWLYGRQRIMAFLIELEPATSLYLHDEQIPTETGRNRTAVLYLLEQAGCPWAELGASWSNCGPLYDDFETFRAWTVETNPAAPGAWWRGNPVGVWWNGPKQLDTVHSGSYALTTGPSAGSSASDRDLDGLSRVVSPVVHLASGAGNLSFYYYFAHSNASRPADDWFRVSIEDVGASTRTLVYEEKGTRPRRRRRLEAGQPLARRLVRQGRPDRRRGPGRRDR